MRRHLGVALLLIVAVEAAAGQSSTIDTVTVANPEIIRVAQGQVYPNHLWQAGIGGNVVWRVRILPSGQVDSAEVVESSGHPSLDEASARLLPLARYASADTSKWAVWINRFGSDARSLTESERLVCPPVAAFLPALRAIAHYMREPHRGLTSVESDGTARPKGPKALLVEIQDDIRDSPHCGQFLTQALDLHFWRDETDKFGQPLICLDGLCSRLPYQVEIVALVRVGTTWPGHEWVFAVETSRGEGGRWWVHCEELRCTVSRRSVALG